MPKIVKQLIVSCTLCGKTFSRLRSRIEPSGHVFCSHTCSAKYTNHYRETRLILAKRKRMQEKPKCANPNCQKQIGINNTVYCSPPCRVEAAKLHDCAFVIERIRQFAKDYGRIPVKYEFVALYHRARLAFGTWNKAIMAAGYEPNPVMFAKHYIALDGHKCDSLAERIVDDWLCRRHINHRIHVPYPWGNGMSADFVVGDNYIELFGLQGEHKRYDELKKLKLKLAKRYGIKILSLSLSDVYRNGLKNKLVRLNGRRRLPN